MRADELEPRTTAPVTATREPGRFRAWLDARPVVRICYRTLIGTVGACVIVAGVIVLPTPLPGWLIIFSGLALLGTEFAWARRIAGWLRRQLARLWAWWQERRRSRGDAATRATTDRSGDAATKNSAAEHTRDGEDQRQAGESSSSSSSAY